MANVCAIIPPMETPTTWAEAIPRASSRPAASAARSAIEYGGVHVPSRSPATSGAPVSSNQVDRPTSRLS